MKRYFHDISIASDAILTNKLKSILTALGIIFGVAAVISMLAIGNGARQEILDQIKLVGINNIVIKPLLSTDEESQNDEARKPNKFSPGLTLSDVDAIREIVPTAARISPEIMIDTYVIQNGKKKDARLFGVTSEYFDLFNIKLQDGQVFNDYQDEYGQPVCIIGSAVKTKFFSNIDPVHQYLKCGTVWLRIIGVIENRNISSSAPEKLGVSNTNENIYIPVKTMLLRYKNRALVTASILENFRRSSRRRNSGSSGEDKSTKAVNYHQLDKIIVQAKEPELLNATSEILNRLLKRRHSGVEDFEIVVPELLLKQQQRTKDIFNIVLGAIASISLIVGGIGIMNIMLASVMERIKEIGTRLAIGATKRDIVVQFLAESTMISVVGGFIGVLLGLVLSKLIMKFSGILTLVTPVSVLIAFGISAFVGILFGYMPAKRASGKDPVESLRHE